MPPKLIKHYLAEIPKSQEIEIFGWVRTKRDLKNLVFIEVNDGSCFSGIQCAFNRSAGLDKNTEDALCALTTGASIKITGRLVPSPASGQAVEIAAESLSIIGNAPAESKNGEKPSLDIHAYPLQKKRHSFEFLREIAHLRPRTNTFASIARLRSFLSFAIHRYFKEHDFFYLHTPIIACGDCEGAGAMFQVTTLDPDKIKNSAGGNAFYTEDFFGKKTYLTVSGQLEAETYAAAVSRVYTFGPAFRAENSNTARHLAEFWMVEPEAAFFDLEDNMMLAEDFIKSLLKAALDECGDEMKFFDSFIEKGIIENLQRTMQADFLHITYTDAVRELEKAGRHFEYKPRWGNDLQSEHEKFLTEQIAKGPVIVTDYPKDIKAFYMKLNDDEKTVRAMDVLVPGIGEIIGGSQREENLEKLVRRMEELNLSAKDYYWYLDLRRYGTVVHSGFGLGFERLVQYVSGMANIRDVIPFPRAAGQAEF